MKQIKRIVAYVLFMSILLLNMENVALAEGIDYYQFRDFVYRDASIRNGCEGIAITNYKGVRRKLKIPSKIPGQYGWEKVTAIDECRNAKTIKEIYLPATIQDVDLTEIPNLKKVTISKKNKYLKVKNGMVLNKKGTEVIACPCRVKKVKIPNTVKEITHNAFSNSKIRNIKLGKNVKRIGGGAFSNCKSLVSVTFNNKLTEIENEMFDGCKNLKEITLGSKVKEVRNSVFSECITLRKVVIKNKKCSPVFSKDVFEGAAEGIKFYVPNRKVAKQLSKNLLCTEIKDAKIYVGKKCIYSGITGTNKAWKEK